MERLSCCVAGTLALDDSWSKSAPALEIAPARDGRRTSGRNLSRAERPPEGNSADRRERHEWAGLSRGTPDALARFFDQYFPKVYALALHLCGHPSGAEDLTQDVFLRVQQALVRFDESQDPWPWLVTITRNLHRDGLRRTRSVPVGGLHQEERRATVAEPADKLIRREQQERLREALDRLPEEQRETVILRSFAGLSHSEIAAQLGLSDVAVRKRYSRALTTLGRLLRDQDE